MRWCQKGKRTEEKSSQSATTQKNRYNFWKKKTNKSNFVIHLEEAKEKEKIIGQALLLLLPLPLLLQDGHPHLQWDY